MKKSASEASRKWNGYRNKGTIVKKMPEKPALWCHRCEEPHDPEMHLDRWAFDSGRKPNKTRSEAIIDNMF